MPHDAQPAKLIDDIYAHALSRDDPTPLLGRIAQSLGFRTICVVTMRNRYSPPTCNAAWGVDVESCQRLEEQHGMTHWVVDRLQGRIRAGDFIFRDELVSDAGFPTHAAGTESRRRFGLEDGVTVCLESSPERLVCANFAGSVLGTDRTRQRELLAALGPHWARAVQIYIRIEQSDASRLACETWTNFSGIAAVLYDNAGAPYFANARAKGLSWSDGLGLQNGELHASDETDNSRLRLAIRTVIGASPAQRSAAIDVAVCRPSGKRPYRLTVIPLAVNPRRDNRQPAALVTIVDPEQEIRVPLRRCHAVFGFTPAEAEVAIGVMNGKSIEQIAAAQGHSIATSRNLLKRVFMKAGVSRQSELAHLMLRSPLFFELSSLAEAGKQARPRTIRQQPGASGSSMVRGQKPSTSCML